MGLSFAENLALRAIRGLLNGTVGKYTPEELQDYIDRNGNLWGDTSEGMKQIIRTVKNQFFTHYRKFFDQINTDLLVKWLEQDQPQLHAVITANQENYTWYDRQVNTFKKQIEEI